MSLAADKKRWDDLHAAYAKAQEALSEYDRQLHSHYGRYEKSWLKAAQRKKLESLQDRVDKIGDKIVELIKKISPRDWMSGVPAYWIRSELTWEDAIRPKGEPLSVTPPTAWGHNAPIQERTMTRETETHDAEAAGAEYAQEQIESDYFNDWVRSQLAEAARMDPSQVLPLETKDDAREIAKNMLQQLYWDTSRDLEPREIARLIGVDDTTREDVKEFLKGFRDTTNASRDWLADELLQIKGEMRGGVREAARRRPEIVYVYMGMIERGPKYNWKEGWSENGRTYPWLTKREAQADARNRGATAKFVRNGGGSVGEARGTVRAGHPTPVSDPEYTIQGLYNDGTIHESFGFDDEATAIADAKALSRSNLFEGDYVRVITRDGDLVWDSRGRGVGEGRTPSRRTTESLPVIFRAEKSGDAKGEVTAVFPTLPGTGPNDFTVYASAGQHSTGTHGWYNQTRAATPAEYAMLLAELRSIYERGPDAVKLRVVQRFTRDYDAERRYG